MFDEGKGTSFQKEKIVMQAANPRSLAYNGTLGPRYCGTQRIIHAHHGKPSILGRGNPMPQRDDHHSHFEWPRDRRKALHTFLASEATLCYLCCIDIDDEPSSQVQPSPVVSLETGAKQSTRTQISKLTPPRLTQFCCSKPSKP